MATRRRRTTPRTVETTPEPTHEEMLEVAAEREAEAQVEESPEEEEKAIEAFIAMAAADTFEALQKAEEESGAADFFDPDSYKTEVRLPAVETPYVAPPKAPAPKPHPRYILRTNTRHRKG